jgi:1,2-diacylglycerol 3-alpha-glucosyltransferase
VLVVAPEFSPAIPDEEDVIRTPAIQHFNGSDFSVAVPIPGFLSRDISAFEPDIIHSHHPFILGDTALRFGAKHDIPVVFTHHTQYEKYTHYVPGDSEAMQRFAVELAVGYCNLCDAVIAPSATIRDRLVRQGVIASVAEIPTGVDTQLFGGGDGISLRKELGIPENEFVVGHVGRLAPEKGLEFLSTAVSQFVADVDNARFLVAGDGPSVESIQSAFARRGIENRLMLLGQLERTQLADLYAAMDVFAFASQSETQGMVITEAMAAGTPVVAVDAPGVREILRDSINGILLDEEDVLLFTSALDAVRQLPAAEKAVLATAAKSTALAFSIEATASMALKLYDRVIAEGAQRVHDSGMWGTAQRRIAEEWKIWSNATGAMVNAVFGDGTP